MKAYSTDLREKVLAARDNGMKPQQVVQVFGISRATLHRWDVARRATGTLAPLPRRGLARRLTSEQHPLLEAQLRAQPDATLEQHAQQWQQEQAQSLSRATMARAIGRLGWTRKKRA